MGLAPLARHLADRGAHDIALIAYTAYADQRPELADFLLRSGASVHARGLGGITALHLAAGKGSIELAGVLLAHGADVKSRRWQWRCRRSRTRWLNS